MESSQYSAVRPAGREHIPIYPNGFIAVRIAQLVVGVVILGLGAFGVSVLAFDGDNFIVAVAIFNLIAGVYNVVAEFGPPMVFNYWAILGVDIFMIIMWLSSFALLASEVSDIFKVLNFYYNHYNSSYAASLAAASGLGGLEFLLYIVSVAVHSVMLYRHRAAGLHCMPGAAATITEPKPLQPQAYAVPQPQTIPLQPQQPVYPQQPTPQPQVYGGPAPTDPQGYVPPEPQEAPELGA